MRCKLHPYENGVGVCAPCLRERLLALLADQPDDQRDHPRNPEPPPPPPPLQCPRSVSSYISHRRSADPAASSPCRLSRLFYSTPQIGPAACGGTRRRRGSGKSSLLASLFGSSRSEKTDPGFSEAPWSSSWLSVLLHGHRKKKNSRLFAAEGEAARRSCRGRDRGLSPDTDCSASGDECAAESPGWWWRPTPSPMRRPAAAAHHHHHNHHVGGLAGFAVCLSPLVRASPSHRRSQTSAEAGFSNDLRSTPNRRHRRHVSGGATSLGPNRSRKLADFGRFR